MKSIRSLVSLCKVYVRIACTQEFDDTVCASKSVSEMRIIHYHNDDRMLSFSSDSASWAHRIELS